LVNREIVPSMSTPSPWENPTTLSMYDTTLPLTTSLEAIHDSIRGYIPISMAPHHAFFTYASLKL